MLKINFLIKKFIGGDDRSLACANELEVALDDSFPEDEEIQDTILMLASYRPGGGDYLYSEEEVKKQLEKIKYRFTSAGDV